MKMVLAILSAVVLMTGCSDKTTEPSKPQAAKPVFSEEEIGLRKTSLYSEKDTVASKTQYATTPPMSGQFYDRAFDNAPPMIPHDTEGMLPITINDNQCIGCHMPDVAASMAATPIPQSHFTSFRPETKIGKDGKVIKEGRVVANSSDILTVQHTLSDLNKARFNCSQCHAPQSTGGVLVENTFKPDFQDPAMKRKSSLLDTINEGVR